MLRIVLLSALLLVAGVVLAPEASANDLCGNSVVTDHLAGGCSPTGIVCRDVMPLLGATC